MERNSCHQSGTESFRDSFHFNDSYLLWFVCSCRWVTTVLIDPKQNDIDERQIREIISWVNECQMPVAELIHKILDFISVLIYYSARASDKTDFFFSIIFHRWVRVVSVWNIVHSVYSPRYTLIRYAIRLPLRAYTHTYNVHTVHQVGWHNIEWGTRPSRR